MGRYHHRPPTNHRGNRYVARVPGRTDNDDVNVTEDWNSNDVHEKREGRLTRIAKGFVRDVKERNSPERRMKRIGNLRLKAQEESLKTQVYKAKQARKPKVPKVTSRGYGRGMGRMSRSGMGYTAPRHSYEGMNSLLGPGSSQKERVPRVTRGVQEKKWGGMDRLLGSG